MNSAASSKETSIEDKGKSSLGEMGEDHGRCEELGMQLFFASKKCRELQEKIHRLAGSMNLPFNRARRERLNGRKRVPQAVALSRKRENVGVMDQTIHQRCRQAVVPKHSIPLSKL